MKQSSKAGSRSERRPIFVSRAGVGLACLLLASAGVCWIAANWPYAAAWQKLAGAQLLVALLSIAAMWRFGAARAGVSAVRGAANHNFSSGAHLVALAGVAAGVLLALIGQIYQTGADAWQLFLGWAVLLLPWLLTVHTVFLGLLFALVLNTALALYMDVHGLGIWGLDGWAAGALLAALLNAVLLALYERCIAWFGDAWRIGPRALSAALAGWLLVAAFAGSGSSGGPIGYSILGWAVLAAMYLAYARWRSDLVIVSLSAMAAFVLLVLPLLYWVGSEAGLLLVVVALIVATAVGLRKLGKLLRARAIQSEPWYISAFRLVAMGITAVLLVVFLLITLDFEVESIWILGLVCCLAGLAVFRLSGSDVLRELGLALMTAGLLLCVGGFFALHEEGSGVAVYALAALGAGLYVFAGHAAFRFLTAFFVLGMLAILTWPHGAWEEALFDSFHLFPDSALALYMRVWWFSLGGVLALLMGRGAQAGPRYRPLGWALAFLAQTMVWNVPAPQFTSFADIWRYDASVLIVWLACGALPVAALGAVLWRKPVLPAAVRVGAPLALAVAAAGWMGAPGVSLALLWLIVGFAMGHRTLMGFGVLALLAYLARFYYQLDTTLLHKSFVLAATGAWLLLVAWALKRANSMSAQSGDIRGNSESPAAAAAASADASDEAGLAVSGAGASATSAASAAGVSGASAVGAVRTAGNTKTAGSGSGHVADDGIGAGAGVSGAAAAAGVRAAGKHRLLWSRIGCVAGLLVVLAVANFSIYKYEKILANGQRVVLELAPADPRSLMQGDYMRLVFDVANQVPQAVADASQEVRQDIESKRAGLLVLQSDSAGVHRLVAVLPVSATLPSGDSAIQLTQRGAEVSGEGASGAEAGQGASAPGPVLLKFRQRDHQVRVVTDAWFFPEGQAAQFERARYGEFRVDNKGEGLLVKLLDAQLRPLSGN